MQILVCSFFSSAFANSATVICISPSIQESFNNMVLGGSAFFLLDFVDNLEFYYKVVTEICHMSLLGTHRCLLTFTNI